MENKQLGWRLRSGFIGMFLIVIVMVLFAPLLVQGVHAHLALQLFLNLFILFTIHTLSKSHFTFWLCTALLILVVVYDVLSIHFLSGYYMAYGHFFCGLFLLAAVIFFSAKVFYQNLIDTNLIFGAITIYLLAGLLWEKFYWLFNIILPGSFQGVHTLSFMHFDLQTAIENQFDLRYFSFTVLSTLGFGDIVPTHHLTKSLTILEAMFGQLFVAIAIAKMVGIWRSSGKE